MSQLQPVGPVSADLLEEAAPVVEPKRWGPVVASVLVALAIAVLFIRVVPDGVVTTFRMAGGQGAAARVAPWVIPSRPGLVVLALFALAMAVWAYRAPRWANLALGLALLSFVGAFLIWAAAGKSLNLLAMLQSTLVRAVPLTLAALSGVMCERSGVINIAIEGMMLTAAFGAVLGTTLSGGSLWIGLLVAMLTGLLMAWVHGVLSIKYKVDQIVSGTVINILAVGLTSYLSGRFLQDPAFNWLNRAGTFAPVKIPVLNRIPVIGPLLFEGNFFFYLTIALVIGLSILLFRTRFGLRVRAVGEHPRAADTLGVNVYLMRYAAVLLGGVLAGLGGAYFTIGSVGRFDEQMTAGRGFIGLAAMIFGNWTPAGAFGASLLFGFADSLQTRLQILGIPIPSEFLLMAPYIVTIVVISGLVGRATPPAADGQPYEK